MRIKDTEKQEALFQAAVKVVNEIGFASSSVSKIAREAGVSPATLYTYFANKEDLLVSTYMKIKQELSKEAMKKIDDDMPIRDCFKQVWINYFEFATTHRDYSVFAEQFANSPYNEKVDLVQFEKMFEPIGRLVRRGIEMKIIKNVNPDVIGAFVFYPVLILTNPRLCRNFKITDEQIQASFQLAWDAIKL